MALTGHVFGVGAGGLIAGGIVDRFKRHGMTTAGAIKLAGAFVLLSLIAGLPGALLAVIVTVADMALGPVLWPRDSMVRGVTPPGQTGTVYGFVFVGDPIVRSLAP